MSETPSGWQGWLPIETAPRDGRTLLLWDASREKAVFGYWSDEEDRWLQDLNDVEIYQAIYWMSIEPPPTGEHDE